jgi:hypothetical protein
MRFKHASSLRRPPGSSPRARGTHRRHGRRQPRDRFIPAGAGNTRACGDRCADRGSSPRARGTLDQAEVAQHLSRFIPAGAGNTMRRAHSRHPASAVHPRGRGEHAMSTHRPGTRAGSSPRARGTRGRNTSDSRPGRFIPAGAGNTPHLALRCVRRHRFIPAGAGNTRSRYRSRQAVRFIPAGAGNTRRSSGVSVGLRGSSPRARGTLRAPKRFIAGAGNPLDENLVSLRGFIPAGAGNTAMRATRCRPSAVHPRGRGEHRCRAAPARQRRFIPAGAGNTAGAGAMGGSIPAGAGNTPPLDPRSSGRTPVHPRGRGEH